MESITVAARNQRCLTPDALVLLNKVARSSRKNSLHPLQCLLLMWVMSCVVNNHRPTLLRFITLLSKQEPRGNLIV